MAAQNTSTRPVLFKLYRHEYAVISSIQSINQSSAFPHASVID